MSDKIVRATAFIKEKILFRTSAMTFIFPGNDACNSVRKELFDLFIESTRTVFSSASFTQGGVSVRSSRNYTLGYYMLALQAKEIHSFLTVNCE